MYCDINNLFLCNKSGLQEKNSIAEHSASYSSVWGGAGVGWLGVLNSDIWSEFFSSENHLWICPLTQAFLVENILY